MDNATSDPARKCVACLRTKPISTGFYQSRTHAGRRVCRECNALRTRESLAAGTAFINAYKMSVGCVDCGWCEHPQALELDHRPGEEKVADVATMRGKPLEVIRAEIEKCDVVCANCHRIRTFERRDFARNIHWDVRKREREQVAPAAPIEPDLLSLLDDIA